jgi:hypothetical protein
MGTLLWKVSLTMDFVIEHIGDHFSFWEIIILLPTVILHVSGPFP